MRKVIRRCHVPNIRFPVAFTGFGIAAADLAVFDARRERGISHAGITGHRGHCDRGCAPAPGVVALQQRISAVARARRAAQTPCRRGFLQRIDGNVFTRPESTRLFALEASGFRLSRKRRL
jgi:hypothetical protein